MLATTESRGTAVAKPVKRERLSAFECKRKGIHLLILCNARGTYDGILRQVRRSKPTAGGPIFRLGIAVWNFENRRALPHCKAYRQREEESFGQLLRHADQVKARHYGVWQAIEDFLAIRINVFGTQASPPLFPQHLEEYDLRVPQAIFGLHLMAEHTGKPYLKELVRLCLGSGGNLEESVILLADAVWKLEKWRGFNCPATGRAKVVLAINTLLHHWHSNPWLQQTVFARTIDLYHQSFRHGPKP